MPTPTFFGPEIPVNTTISGFQGNSSIAGLAGGKFVAVWEDDSLAGAGGFASIRAQLFNADGSKLGGEFVTNGNEGFQRHSTVRHRAQGRPLRGRLDQHVAQRCGRRRWRARERVQCRRHAGRQRVFINQVTQSDQGDVSISALADGGTARLLGVTVSGNDDLDIRGRHLQCRRHAAQRQWSPIDGSPGLELGSSTVSLIGGGFVTVWTELRRRRRNRRLRARISARGDLTPTAHGCGSEFVVNSTTLNDQSQPTVTALANGGFAVAWTHVFDGNDTDVFLRIFNANGLPQTQDVFIDGDVNTNEGSVSMTALADGNLFVTWTDAGSAGDTDGFFDHINGKVISGVDGSELGNQFIINTTTALDQVDPSVTVLAMAGWRSRGGTEASVVVAATSVSTSARRSSTRARPP